MEKHYMQVQHINKLAFAPERMVDTVHGVVYYVLCLDRCILPSVCQTLQNMLHTAEGLQVTTLHPFFPPQ